MIAKQSQIIPIDASKKGKPEIQAMVDEFNNNEVFLKVVGYNDAIIDDCKECLGCLMADGDLALADADLAFQNYGGVRFDTLGARPILLKDLFSLDPFDNELVLFNMTGQEVVDFLAVSFETDWGPNYCAGCTYSFSVNEEGRMTDCEVILADGKPIDLEKTYKVVMNSYMSSAFAFSHEDPGTSLFRTSNEALTEYLAAHPHINYSGTSRVVEK
jgi:5'-nucleotidase